MDSIGDNVLMYKTLKFYSSNENPLQKCGCIHPFIYSSTHFVFFFSFFLLLNVLWIWYADQPIRVIIVFCFWVVESSNTIFIHVNVLIELKTIRSADTIEKQQHTQNHIYEKKEEIPQFQCKKNTVVRKFVSVNIYFLGSFLILSKIKIPFNEQTHTQIVLIISNIYIGKDLWDGRWARKQSEHEMLYLCQMEWAR